MSGFTRTATVSGPCIMRHGLLPICVGLVRAIDAERLNNGEP